MKILLTIAGMLGVVLLWGDNGTLEPKLDTMRQYVVSDPEKADSLGQALLTEINPDESPGLLVKVYAALGMTNYYRSKYLLSSKYYLDALHYLELPAEAELEANIWNNLGINYEISDEYEKAIEAYLKSLDYALTKGDSLNIYRSYLNLGLLYAKISDFDQAEKRLREAFQYFSRQEDPFNTALACQNLGFLYTNTNQNTNAQRYFKQALSLVEQLDIPLEYASLYIDYISFLLLTDNYAAFEDELPSFKVFYEEIDNDFMKARAGSVLGSYEYWAHKNYRLAKDFFLEALEIFKKNDAPSSLTEIYPKLADCYFRLGEPDRANEYLTAFESNLREKFADESATKIAELRTVHEVDQKEAKAALLQVRLAQKDKVIGLYLALVFLFNCVSSVTAYFLWVVKNKERALVARNIELSNLVDVDEKEGEGDPPTGDLDLGEAYFNAQMQELFVRVKHLVVKKKKYLDPGLKLSDVAFELGTNEKYISQAILFGSKMRFNAFINFYRINQAKKLLQRESLTKLSIGDVAKKSGFNYQTNFQRKFKEQTGVTPYTFQRLASLNKVEEEE